MRRHCWLGGIDPARLARAHLWRMYRRGASPLEAAQLTACVARQEQEAWAAAAMRKPRLQADSTRVSCESLGWT
jgi:hypothetical protein